LVEADRALIEPSLRGAQRRSNRKARLDCAALLAMTNFLG